ncbi:MAG: hypothetical protein R3C26_23910 [Calditrichia bacterium]
MAAILPVNCSIDWRFYHMRLTGAVVGAVVSTFASPAVTAEIGPTVFSPSFSKTSGIAVFNRQMRQLSPVPVAVHLFLVRDYGSAASSIKVLSKYTVGASPKTGLFSATVSVCGAMRAYYPFSRDFTGR